jgi:hypothetical protein
MRHLPGVTGEPMVMNGRPQPGQQVSPRRTARPQQLVKSVLLKGPDLCVPVSGNDAVRMSKILVRISELL